MNHFIREMEIPRLLFKSLLLRLLILHYIFIAHSSSTLIMPFSFALTIFSCEVVIRLLKMLALIKTYSYLSCGRIFTSCMAVECVSPGTRCPSTYAHCFGEGNFTPPESSRATADLSEIERILYISK